MALQVQLPLLQHHPRRCENRPLRLLGRALRRRQQGLYHTRRHRHLLPRVQSRAGPARPLRHRLLGQRRREPDARRLERDGRRQLQQLRPAPRGLRRLGALRPGLHQPQGDHRLGHLHAGRSPGQQRGANTQVQDQQRVFHARQPPAHRLGRDRARPRHAGGPHRLDQRLGVEQQQDKLQPQPQLLSRAACRGQHGQRQRQRCLPGHLGRDHAHQLDHRQPGRLGRQQQPAHHIGHQGAGRRGELQRDRRRLAQERRRRL